MSKLAKDPIAALWVANLARPLADGGEWLALLEAQMAAARAGGATLFLAPEYVSNHWVQFAPRTLTPRDEVPWMAEQAERLQPALAALARRHELLLAPGTAPFRLPEGRYVNRAWLFTPEGESHHQDKLRMIPGEDNLDDWPITPGEEFRVLEWRGLRVGVCICFDVELPSLAARLAPLELDLLLVPSMTTWPAGYHRVFNCARARTVELQCLALAVGCKGPARMNNRVEGNFSGAGVYGPCLKDLGDGSGVLAELAPTDGTDGADGLLLSEPLPVGRVRELRAGAAEVWPTARWSAEGIRLVESAAGAAAA